MTNFDGGRDDLVDEPASAHDHRVGSVIAAALAVLVLAALLSGCHSWPNCRPGGDCIPHGWLD